MKAMPSRLLLSFLLACGVAACGGGSSDEVIATEYLAFQRLSTGVAAAEAPPLNSQVTLISSEEQLQQLLAGRIPQLPSGHNFAVSDLVYVEGLGDRDPQSVVRLASVTRVQGVEFINTETCSSVAREPGPHRPFALYSTVKVPNLQSFSESRAFFDCPSVSRLAATRVASGVAGAAGAAPPTYIRDLVTYTQAAQMVGLTAPPPDFSQVMLVLVTTLSDASTLRLMGAYQDAADGSREVVAELCGTAGQPDARAYLLVSLPASTVDPRIVIASATPPNCVTATP